MKIEQPLDSESCYAYRLDVNGAKVGAYLTYEIGKDVPEQRSLLLVSERKAQSLIASLDNAALADWERLREVVRHHSASHGRALETTKSIVNQLYEGELKLKNVAVAVHRFGVVPVFVVPGSGSKVTLKRVHQDVHVSIYPDDTVRGRVPGQPPEMPTRVEFIKSLGVRLDIQLKRYLEDVAELLYDIQHHCSLANAVRNGRAVEVAVSTSIDDKIDCLMQKSRRGANAEAEERAAMKVKSQYEARVLVATYARAYVVSLLREFYACLGLEPDLKYTFDELYEIVANIRDGEPEESQADPLDAYPDIRSLHQTLALLTSSDPQNYDQIVSKEDDEEWVRRFIEFASFVAFLRQHQPIPGTARLFVSTQHDVPNSEFLLANMERRIGEHHGTSVQLNYVKSATSGIAHKSLIRRTIWISDSVGALVPSSTVTVAGGEPKSFNWIGLELEYSTVLKKGVDLFLERGAELNDLIQEIESLTESLAPFARGRADRVKRLVERLRDHLSIPFRLDDINTLPAGVEKWIVELVRLREAHAVRVVQACLEQLHPRTQSVVGLVHEVAKKPMKLQQIAVTLAPKQHDRMLGSLQQMRNHVRKHPIVLAGQRIELVMKLRGNQYVGGIPAILAALLPETSDERRQLLSKQIVADLVPSGMRARQRVT